MYGQFAARCSLLAARRSPLAPRPDLTPLDNSQRAHPLSLSPDSAAQIYKYLPPPCSRLSRRSFSSRDPAFREEPVFPLACRGPIENVFIQHLNTCCLQVPGD